MCVLLSGCSLPYLVRQAAGGVSLLARGQPVDAVLRDRRAHSVVVRAGLAEVQRVLEFARTQGLRVGNAYRTFVDLRGKPPVYVLFACPPDRLEPVTWYFPFVGRAPYKGYFDLDAARREAREFERRGLETLLTSAVAYSMLGWLPDPIFSSILDETPGRRAETLFHELTHRTIFLTGEIAFNESVATFVGELLAERFLNVEYGPDADEVVNYRAHLSDRRLFHSIVGRVRRQLETALSHPDREQRLAARKQIFAEARRRVRRATFQTDEYRAVVDREWSLPLVLSVGLYESRSELFARLLALSHDEVPRFLARLAKFEPGEDSIGSFEAWLDGEERVR